MPQQSPGLYLLPYALERSRVGFGRLCKHTVCPWCIRSEKYSNRMVCPVTTGTWTRYIRISVRAVVRNHSRNSRERGRTSRRSTKNIIIRPPALSASMRTTVSNSFHSHPWMRLWSRAGRGNARFFFLWAAQPCKEASFWWRCLRLCADVSRKGIV